MAKAKHAMLCAYSFADAAELTGWLAQHGFTAHHNQRRNRTEYRHSDGRWILKTNFVLTMYGRQPTRR